MAAQREKNYAFGAFLCVQCDRRYENEKGLREHYRGSGRVHPKCPACGKGMADDFELDQVRSFSTVLGLSGLRLFSKHKGKEHPEFVACFVQDCFRAAHDEFALAQVSFSFLFLFGLADICSTCYTGILRHRRVRIVARVPKVTNQ